MLGAACVLPALPGHPGAACPLRMLTGIPCPLCGMTTSVEETVHLNLGERARGEPGGPRAVVGASCCFSCDLRRDLRARGCARRYARGDVGLRTFPVLDHLTEGSPCLSSLRPRPASQTSRRRARRARARASVSDFVALIIDGILVGILVVLSLVLKTVGMRDRDRDLGRVLRLLRGRPVRPDARQAGLGIRVDRLQHRRPDRLRPRASSAGSGGSSRPSRATSATSGCSGTRRSSAGTTRSPRRSSSRSRPIPSSTSVTCGRSGRALSEPRCRARGCGGRFARARPRPRAACR